MQTLQLVFPTLEMEKNAMDYRQEHFNNGEHEINGDGGLDLAASYAEWIKKIQSDLTIDDDKQVPATVYFAYVGDCLVGTIQIRHKLNDHLLSFGGHIGYGVRPTERRKGYASEMLAQALEKCRQLGIHNVLVTCNNDNVASARTVIKNGGVLENELAKQDGTVMQRYWIEKLA